MLDMAMFRDNADAIRADHDRRGIPHDSIDEVIRLDEEWRKAQYDVDQLRRKRNEAARGIADAKKSGDEAAAKALPLAGSTERVLQPRSGGPCAACSRG